MSAGKCGYCDCGQYDDGDGRFRPDSGLPICWCGHTENEHDDARVPTTLLCTDDEGVVTERKGWWRSLRKVRTPITPIPSAQCDLCLPGKHPEPLCPNRSAPPE